MAQWLKALSALSEDLGLSHRTHLAAHSCLELQSRGSFFWSQNSHAHKIIIIIKNISLSGRSVSKDFITSVSRDQYLKDTECPLASLPNRMWESSCCVKILLFWAGGWSRREWTVPGTKQNSSEGNRYCHNRAVAGLHHTSSVWFLSHGVHVGSCHMWLSCPLSPEGLSLDLGLSCGTQLCLFVVQGPALDPSVSKLGLCSSCQCWPLQRM